MALKTDYKDDVPVSERRKYQMVDNGDGTVSFVDVTKYSQEGDTFGAADINATNEAVNEKFDSGDVVDPMETTESGFAADALAVKNQFDEQNKNFENIIRLAYTEVTQNFPVGYSSVESSCDIENGYKAVCYSASTNTVSSIDITSVNPSGSLRVWNRTTSEREVKITFWWIVFKEF